MRCRLEVTTRYCTRPRSVSSLSLGLRRVCGGRGVARRVDLVLTALPDHRTCHRALSDLGRPSTVLVWLSPRLLRLQLFLLTPLHHVDMSTASANRRHTDDDVGRRVCSKGREAALIKLRVETPREPIYIKGVLVRESY